MKCALFKIVLVFFALNISLQGNTQNLVPNPSFEDYDKCPGDYSQSELEFRVRNWRSANTGTPDNFNECSTGGANVPHNWAGVSEAFQGKGYVGIFLWMNSKNNYREYLQSKLTQPLLKDSLYSIEFHYKLSSYSKYAIDRIGMMLSDSILSFQDDQAVKLQPTISVIRDSSLTQETGSWETSQQEYRAKGGERYVTIGNFFDNQTTHSYFIQFRPILQSMLAKSSYYYIDDVKVIPMFIQEQNILTTLVPWFSNEDVSLEKTYILKNIQFEFSQFKLIKSSFNELNALAMWLKEHPFISIKITGHTDDQGTDDYNLQLSINRAKSVSTYLSENGISSARINTSGSGKSNPLVQSVDEVAREMNRRVEIKFLD